MGPAKCWECRGYITPGQIRKWHRVAWLVHAVIKGVGEVSGIAYGKMVVVKWK